MLNKFPVFIRQKDSNIIKKGSMMAAVFNIIFWGVLGFYVFTSCDNSSNLEESEKGCNGGNMRSCSDLGYIYMTGAGVDQDFFKAETLFQKACDKGSGMGCNNLGVLYINGKGVKQNNAKGIELYTSACHNYKTGLACHNLGEMYENGLYGTKKDNTKAKEYYGLACDYKYNEGCNKYTEFNTK